MSAWWARTWPALLGATVVLTVAAPAAVASYLHARAVVARHDPVMAPWLPLSVDGMLLAALVVMWVRRRAGRPVGRGPWAAFAFGVGVTLAANAAAVEAPSIEAYAVNLFPPVMLAVALELVALVAGRAPARAAGGTLPLPTVPDEVPTAAVTAVSSADDRPGDRVGDHHERTDDEVPAVEQAGHVDRAALAELAASGAGRRRAARALGTTEYRAGRLLAAARNGHHEEAGAAR